MQNIKCNKELISFRWPGSFGWFPRVAVHIGKGRLFIFLDDSLGLEHEQDKGDAGFCALGRGAFLDARQPIKVWSLKPRRKDIL